MASPPAAPISAEFASAAVVECPPALRPKRVLGVWAQMMLNLPASIWMLQDVTILTLGICFGYFLFVSPVKTPYPHVELWQAFPIMAGSLVVSSLVFGLYQRDTLTGRSRILARMLLSAALAVVLTYAVVYVVMYCTVLNPAADAIFFSGRSVVVMSWRTRSIWMR